MTDTTETRPSDGELPPTDHLVPDNLPDSINGIPVLRDDPNPVVDPVSSCPRCYLLRKFCDDGRYRFAEGRYNFHPAGTYSVYSDTTSNPCRTRALVARPGHFGVSCGCGAAWNERPYTPEEFDRIRGGKVLTVLVAPEISDQHVETFARLALSLLSPASGEIDHYDSHAITAVQRMTTLLHGVALHQREAGKEAQADYYAELGNAFAAFLTRLVHGAYGEELTELQKLLVAQANQHPVLALVDVLKRLFDGDRAIRVAGALAGVYDVEDTDEFLTQLQAELAEIQAKDAEWVRAAEQRWRDRFSDEPAKSPEQSDEQSDGPAAGEQA